MYLRIGITGHYASGKSTASKYFKELGAIIIDTDIVARDIVNPGQDAYNKIVEHFGDVITNDDNTLNRQKLADIVFNNKDELQVLESITHPAIFNETMSLSEDKKNIYIINVPLLFQTDFYKYMDKVIIVRAKNDQIFERGKVRDNLTFEAINSRLNNQISINNFLDQADYIIDNTMSLNETKEQVQKIWKTLTANMM